MILNLCLTLPEPIAASFWDFPGFVSRALGPAVLPKHLLLDFAAITPEHQAPQAKQGSAAGAQPLDICVLIILVVFSDSLALSASIPLFFVQKYPLGVDFGPKQNFKKLDKASSFFLRFYLRFNVF